MNHELTNGTSEFESIMYSVIESGVMEGSSIPAVVGWALDYDTVTVG